MENCILYICGEEFKCIASKPEKTKTQITFNYINQFGYAESCPMDGAEIFVSKFIVREYKTVSKLMSLVAKSDHYGRPISPDDIDVKVRFSNAFYHLYDINMCENKMSKNWDESEVICHSYKVEEINSKDKIYQALSQAYCDKENKDKIVDVDLLKSMAEKIMNMFREDSCSKISK